MSTANEQTKKITLPVSGLNCAGCASFIEKELSEKPGVYQVSLDLTTGDAFVEYDATRLIVKSLIDTISEAGYDVAVKKPTFNTIGMTCASCAAHVEKALEETAFEVLSNVRPLDITVVSNNIPFVSNILVYLINLR